MADSSLREEQTVFRHALFEPSNDVPDGLVTPENMRADHRFKVYRNNVTHSLSQALSDGFPAISKLLGAAFFAQMAVEYLRKFPPQSQMIMYFGEDMAAFLADAPNLQKFPYLPDVARLEMALRRAYHAGDAEPIDAAELLELDEVALLSSRLKFAPAVALLCSDFAPLSIWKFNMEDGPKPVMSAEDTLISRVDFDPVAVLLPKGGAVFVHALMGGKTFGAALAETTEQHPSFDLTEILGLLFSTGALTEIM